jgi:hypothetical protein
MDATASRTFDRGIGVSIVGHVLDGPALDAGAIVWALENEGCHRDSMAASAVRLLMHLKNKEAALKEKAPERPGLSGFRDAKGPPKRALKTT